MAAQGLLRGFLLRPRTRICRDASGDRILAVEFELVLAFFIKFNLKLGCLCRYLCLFVCLLGFSLQQVVRFSL